MDGPAFLSEAWLAACNEALATVSTPAAPVLVVTEVVTGARDGADVTVTLIADATGVRLAGGPDDRATAWLTVAVHDAEALHEGRLDPAQALTEGRVRVRGDLRAVVEAAGLLAEAHRALRDR